jgi:outer membrane protein
MIPRRFLRVALRPIVWGLVLAAPAVSAQSQRPDPVPAAPQAAEGDVLKLTIDEAVKRAIENNPDLAIVRLGTDVEAARVSQADSAYRPVFSTVFGRSSVMSPSSSFDQIEGIETTDLFATTGLRQRLRTGGGTWSLGWDASRTASDSFINSFNPTLRSGLLVAFSQPLLRDRKIDAVRVQNVIVKRNLKSSELRALQASVQTVAAVKQAYWTLKAALANVTVQQRSLELAEDLVRQNQARVNVGQAPPLDLVQAQAEVATRRENLIRADAIAKDAEDRLRRLMMDPADTSFWNVRLSPVDEPVSDNTPPDQARAVEGALRDRYDLALLRQDLDNADTNVEFFNNQKLPDVRLEASYRGGGVGGTQLVRTGPFPGTVTGSVDTGFGDVLGQVFGRDFPTWSVGVTVNYPIGRSFEEAGLARAEIERKQSAQRIASLQLQVAETVRSAARDVQSTKERVDAARAGETLAQQRLTVENRRFDAGFSTTFLVTQAQRDLLQAQVNLLQAVLDHQSSLVNFEAVQKAPNQSAGDASFIGSGAVVPFGPSSPQGIFRGGGN